MRLEEIEKLVSNLPKSDFQRFLAWIDDYRWQAWDEQIISDSHSGRLDALLHSVEAEIQSGQAKPL